MDFYYCYFLKLVNIFLYEWDFGFLYCFKGQQSGTEDIYFIIDFRIILLHFLLERTLLIKVPPVQQMNLKFITLQLKVYITHSILIQIRILVKDIISSSQISLPLWSPDFVQLGCDSCNYNHAVNSCTENYHLCSIKELYLGAYFIARAMGWFRLNHEVWTKPLIDSDITEEMGDLNVYKLGICCSNAVIN